jgi:hypothetical protein
MPVLTEGRQQGISPVVKGGQISMRTLNAKNCWGAVAGLLQMGYTTHLVVDMMYEA